MASGCKKYEVQLVKKNLNYSAVTDNQQNKYKL